ncbi:MAG: DUF488 domain-containing protein [Candidatus Binataceae bacterium]
MPVHVVQLGSPRLPGEGLRIGTVRRPPRGVPKTAFASRNYYDVWLPALAPSEELRKFGVAAKSEKDWRTFVRRYRTEMNQPEKRCLLDLLAALSRQTSFAVGCYCADEHRCHRSILRELLAERDAVFG